MTLLDTLKADVLATEASVKSIFTGLRKELTAFLSASANAIAKAVETQAPEIEGDIATFIEQSALAAVTAAELTPGGGQTKMTAALATLGATLAGKGLVLAETEMRSLLENALIAFKTATAGTTNATATTTGTSNVATAQ